MPSGLYTFGEQRDVSLMLMDSQVALGDYVLVQANGFSYERVTPTAEIEALVFASQLTRYILL